MAPGSEQPEIVALNRSRHTLNPFQVLGLLAVFLILSMLGGILAAGLVVPLAAATSTGTNTVAETFYELPTVLDIDEPSQASKIYASDGKTLLASYYSENRLVVPLDQISPHLQNAVVATEDQRFWSHGGVDIRGISRAAVANVASKNSEGGSTLTQQYVKNVLITKASRANDIAGINAAREGSMARKMREAKLAINVEKSMPKEGILEGYLNIAQFGTKVYGVETAANYYFGKSAKDLSIVEAATIAGITQRPSLYDPTLNPEKNEARRNIVLRLMYDQGSITKAEYDEAVATKVVDTLNVQKLTNGCDAAGRNGFFCDYVTKVIMTDPVFGDTKDDRLDLLYHGGLNIVTTLDVNDQKAAFDILRERVPVDKDLNKQQLASALTAVEPGTGKIKVMAQNREYRAGENTAKGDKDDTSKTHTAVNYNTGYDMGGSNGFEVGSTFKTFVLAEWLRSGHTLNEQVGAQVKTWKFREFTAPCTALAPNDTWAPRNAADGLASGQRSVLQATAFSINTAYAHMAAKVNLCSVADMASAAGFEPTNPIENGDVKVVPSMILGVQQTSPLAMANAYATFAAGGVRCTPIAITSVTDREGNSLPVPTANCQQTIDSATVNGVTYALSKVVSSSGGAANAALAGGRPGAGKTGTTNNNTNAWFVGYTPQLSTAVWMGNPENPKEGMTNVSLNGRYYGRIYGGTVTAPIWKKFMDTALKDAPKEKFAPVGINQLGKVVVPKKPKTELEKGTSAEQGKTDSKGKSGDSKKNKKKDD